MFIHLHNHSHYSILKWLPKPKDYVKRAVQLWMNAIAITDTSNISWCHELYKEAKSAWIKPILWTEILVVSSIDNKINHPLVLLAKNLKWYKNILSLISKANLDNIWKIAKIVFEDIIELKKKKWDLEIICLSWNIHSEISYFILSWKSQECIIKKINQYKELFWEDNYFLELIYHEDIPKQKLVTDKLIKINSKYNINVVATNTCFYINKDDKKSQDVIMALWTGHEIKNPDRSTMINWDYSMLSEEQMQIIFWFIPEALSNTVKIANSIHIEINTWWILIPKFKLPKKDKQIYNNIINEEKNIKWIKKLSSDEWYLRYISLKWLNKRYNYNLSEDIIFKLIQKLEKKWLQKKLINTSLNELKEISITYFSKEKKQLLKSFDKKLQKKIERLEYELVVVHEMWFDAYFLIVADYINWARNQDIPVWPGRWSVAWSLMAYLSGITDIDPLKYELLFERFLNPGRVSMPDIDTDFSDKERDRVIKYCSEKYWSDKVVNISTFGTFAARAAVKDVWRVYWVSFSEMNELVKLIPEKPWIKLLSVLENSKEFKEAYDTNKKYKEIIDLALKIEWNIRQLWVHACAVIIAPKSMLNFTALQYPPKNDNIIISQYNAWPLEDLWLLKMDFLWLKNLTIIKRAKKIIQKNKWVEIDILNLDMNDKNVFKIFSAWDTTWIFQFESEWMRKYLIDLSPDIFEDLIAMVSLYRPWPIAYIPTFIDVKYAKKELKYMTNDLKQILQKANYSEKEIKQEEKKLNEDLAKILDISYWIAIYQEQLIFIVQYMAWFSSWEADILRRWIWKKKLDIVEALKEEFIKKWKKFRNYKKETTNYIYTEMIQPAANYSFNRSHAVCYALIAYQTAYLKTYYTTEFLSSVMISDEENMEKIVLQVSECESKWISVLPPSIQESLKHFTYINDKNIRFWLKAIKWIWNWPINKIIESRNKVGWKFHSLEQFIEICWKEVINKKSLNSLILSWAMDSLWDRKQMNENILEILRFCKKNEEKKGTNQIWMFDNLDNFEEKLELKKVSKFSFEEKLRWEKEMIGFSVSWHMLDWLWRYCNRRSQKTKKLKMNMEELLELDKKNNPEKYEIKKDEKWIIINNNEKKQKLELIQAIWVIINIKKIITKTWKIMLFLKCEWFDYDFESIVFPNDVEKYKDKLKIDKIIIVSWNLQINFKYSRKNIQSKNIKISSISMIRKQAKDLWLFNDKKRYLNKKLNELKIEKEQEFEKIINEKIINNKTEKKDKNIKPYIINIPDFANQYDLIDLKHFMQTLEFWFIKIYIEIKWQKIDTKISLIDISQLKEWIIKRWN